MSAVFMRVLIETLDGQFDSLDRRQRILLGKIDEQRLFWTPVSAADSMITLSAGGGVLRSAAMVEQVFLGLTRRLWDDPFEWTLPEKLSTRAAILEYLDEVADTRRTGLCFLTSDADLSSQLPAPEKLKPILQVLVEAIGRAENFLGRAEAVSQLRTDN
jgi:hypothetical protein